MQNGQKQIEDRVGALPKYILESRVVRTGKMTIKNFTHRIEQHTKFASRFPGTGTSISDPLVQLLHLFIDEVRSSIGGNAYDPD